MSKHPDFLLLFQQLIDHLSLGGFIISESPPPQVPANGHYFVQIEVLGLY